MGREDNILEEQDNLRGHKKGLWLRKLLKKELSRKITIGSILLVSVLIAVILFWYIPNKSNQKSTITSSFASLKEVSSMKNLSTLEYTYNSMTHVKDGDVTKYHVAYTGKIVSGIDSNKIIFDPDEKHKTVVVTLPKVTVQDAAVDINSLDFIFEKDSYNTETVAQEAYKACAEDIKRKATNNIKLDDFALENAKNIIEATCKSIKPDYKVIFK